MGTPDDKFNMRFQENDPPCFHCIHLLHIGAQHGSDGWTCKAFPDGIPYGILSRATPHTDIFPTPKSPTQKGAYVFESEVVEWPDGKFKITFDGKWFPVEE